MRIFRTAVTVLVLLGVCYVCENIVTRLGAMILDQFVAEPPLIVGVLFALASTIVTGLMIFVVAMSIAPALLGVPRPMFPPRRLPVDASTDADMGRTEPRP